MADETTENNRETEHRDTKIMKRYKNNKKNEISCTHITYPRDKV